MKKLYKLRQWYSVAEAARRLTVTLGEDVTEKDILQLAIERHIHLSCYMRYRSAQQVYPVTRILSWDKKAMELDKIISKALGQETSIRYDPTRVTHPISSLEISSNITQLEGPYHLDMDYSPALKDWLVGLANRIESTLVPLDGYVVRDADGRMWRIMEAFSREGRKNMGQEETLSKPIFHPDNLYPSVAYPEPEELGFTGTDLTVFEASLLGMDKAEKPLNHKERQSLLTMLIAMAVDGYGYTPTQNKSPTTSEIVNAVERLGLSIDADTVRKWLKEAAEIPDPENLLKPK